jgi:aromatic-L-amino-acid/L-tryptophan decarboxylase
VRGAQGDGSRRLREVATLDGRRVDAAEDLRLAEALARLLPALESFASNQPLGPVPAYEPGTIVSEPLALPAEGAGLDVVLDELTTAVEHGCRINAPGFLGFITVDATTAAAAARTAAAVAGGQRYLLHAFNALEYTGLRWLAQLCGVPAEATGVFTSGGSTANLIALGAARQAAFEGLGVDVAEDGLPLGGGGPLVRVYASEWAHRSVHRSAAVLGLGRSGVRPIATDEHGRIDLRALDAALREDVAAGILPLATVAVAGTTDTGSVDPIAGVVEVARRHNCWVHVDGAYGLVANASPELAPLFDGVADADSWIVDPHKWLSTGTGVGAVYVRDGDLLERAFAEGHAAYLDFFDDELPDAGRSQFDDKGGAWDDRSVELSAPPRGVQVWAVLREIGRAGVADRVERHVGFARTVAERVRGQQRLELLLEPQLSIVCFRYLPEGGVDVDRLNRTLVERLRRETRYVPTSTVVRGAFAIRPCFINPRTTLADAHGLVDEVLRIGAQLDQAARSTDVG